MMPEMPLAVRAATTADPVPALLYASAKPYYDVYAGGEARARALLERVYGKGGHPASWELCAVAEAEGEVAGALSSFPADDGDRLARRFVALTAPRLPAWRWPALLRHLRAAEHVAPHPPPGTLYVDALAVDAGHRRRGVALRLLADAEARAAAAGLRGVSLDTGLQNAPARALYARAGFVEREIRRAPTEAIARAVGGPGFVGYVKTL
jgi:ribosomal protein S18 acetylase RimI-like enzyme